MTFIHATTDPTVALFLSEQGAVNAGTLVMRMYPKTVTRCVSKKHFVRGECKGWQCVAHKSDQSSAPITNSDFERLTA